MNITGIAYLAAVVMAFLLLWMLRDFLLAKKQEFYASEMPCLDLLRREISCMETTINKHAELLGQARGGQPAVECLAVRAVYTQAAEELGEISYDRNVFVDKGITRPGQVCYDIFVALRDQEVPFGFCLLPEKAGENDSLPVALNEKQYAELCALQKKFGRARHKLFKRLEIYK